LLRNNKSILFFLEIILEDRNGMDWNGLEWIGMEWNGLDWIGLDWIGLDWIGLDWIGLDWIGLEELYISILKKETNKIIITWNVHRQIAL
jgi:hypothetical protein